MGLVHRYVIYIALGTLRFLNDLDNAEGHAKMTEPPMRASMWRFGFPTPVNYDDNELFCGGLDRFIANQGRCGTCGDAYDDPAPAHEAGGPSATGIIVRYFPAGVPEIPVTVDVNAFHKGYFEFRLCANNNFSKRVEQSCLDKLLLYVEEGYKQGNPYRFYPHGKGVWNGTIRIPDGVICTQCILQMIYKAGNSWGKDSNDTEACLGCGHQEQFQNCADISIGYPEPPSTTTSTSTSTTTSYKSITNGTDATTHTYETTLADISVSTAHVHLPIKDNGKSSVQTTNEPTTGNATPDHTTHKPTFGKDAEADAIARNELQTLDQSTMLLSDIEQRVIKLEATLLDNEFSKSANRLESMQQREKLGIMKTKMERLEERMRYMEKMIDIMNAKLTILEPIVDVVNTNQRLIQTLLLSFPRLHGSRTDTVVPYMSDRTLDRHRSMLDYNTKTVTKPTSENETHTHSQQILKDKKYRANYDTANKLNSNIHSGQLLTLSHRKEKHGTELRANNPDFANTNYIVDRPSQTVIDSRKVNLAGSSNYKESGDIAQDVKLAPYVETKAKRERTATHVKLQNNYAHMSKGTLSADARKHNVSRKKPLSDILLKRFPAIAQWMKPDNKPELKHNKTETTNLHRLEGMSHLVQDKGYVPGSADTPYSFRQAKHVDIEAKHIGRHGPTANDAALQIPEPKQPRIKENQISQKHVGDAQLISDNFPVSGHTHSHGPLVQTDGMLFDAPDYRFTRQRDHQHSSMKHTSKPFDTSLLISNKAANAFSGTGQALIPFNDPNIIIDRRDPYNGIYFPPEVGANEAYQHVLGSQPRHPDTNVNQGGPSIDLMLTEIRRKYGTAAARRFVRALLDELK